MEEYKLGTRTTTDLSSVDLRIAMLLWGAAGCGKTTLASTAPGHKLWIQFDPDGVLSLRGRTDVSVLDLSGESHSIVERFKDDNPFGIENILKTRPELQTIVFDSATAYQYLGTLNAVANNKNSSIEKPGIHGYAHRNAVILRAVTSLMTLTKRYNKHIIITAHEGVPDKDDDGKVISIPMSMSEGLVNQIGLRLSEVWWMQDTGSERRIALRPVRNRKSMKTRMFDAAKTPEFIWRYNAETWSGDGIENWFKAWQESGGRKLAVPR